MTTVLLEFVTGHLDLAERHRLEALLDDALTAANLGEVSGGGTSELTSSVDIDACDEAGALEAVRTIARDFGIRYFTVTRRSPGEAVVVLKVINGVVDASPLDRDSFMSTAIARGEADGLWALSGAERLVYVISEAEVLSDMEGFDAFVSRYERRGVDALAEAYSLVGAIRLATTLREVATALPDTGHSSLDRANELITSREGYSSDSIATAVGRLRFPATSSS